jgi:hypothetical protein
MFEKFLVKFYAKRRTIEDTLVRCQRITESADRLKWQFYQQFPIDE